ncbi:MAG: 50S ribosomal protein L11 methyltransferase [Acutalibacteraceae bacterium]
MTFTKLKIYASTMGLEAVGGVLDGAGVSCCAIQDPADLDALLADETVPADYVEESLRAQDGEPFLSVYLAQNEQGDAQKRAILAGVETLRGEFGDTLGSLRVETAEVCDDDWRDNWKQFFHPLEIGEKFVVRPSWEPYAGTRPLEIVIDPESSFGTGQHETTRLCLTALEGSTPPERTCWIWAAAAASSASAR